MNKIIGTKFSYISDEKLDKIKKTAPGYDIIPLSDNPDENLLSSCEIIFGNIPMEQILKAENLKWYHTQFAGVDSYFKNGYRLPENLVFTNSSGAYGIAISEHLLTMTMMLQRHIPLYLNNQRKHQWINLGGVKSVYGSTATVVGLGDIGMNFAGRLHALGARVRGISRTLKSSYPTFIERAGVAEDIDSLLPDSDIVALCLPETADTKNIFNSRRIALMKKGSILLNIGRGSAVDEDALAKNLLSGHLGGAGLDVTISEPLSPDSPLWDIENIIITPHVSGGTSLELTLELIVDLFIKHLGNYISGKEITGRVDITNGY